MFEEVWANNEEVLAITSEEVLASYVWSLKKCEEIMSEEVLADIVWKSVSK